MMFSYRDLEALFFGQLVFVAFVMACIMLAVGAGAWWAWNHLSIIIR